MEQKMNSKKSWLLIFPMFMLFACFSANGINGPEPKTKEGIILKSIHDILLSYHYSPLKVDDQFSEKAFNEYFLNLDPSKRFFTAQDINGLNSFKTQIDDEFRAGGLNFFDQNSSVFDATVIRAEKYFNEYIDMPFTFEVLDSIESEEEKMAWASDENELKSRWKKSINYEFLSRYYDEKKSLEKDKKSKAEDTIIAEIRKEVKENMESWFKRLKEIKKSDRFEMYLNTLAHLYDPHTDYFSPKDKEDFNINMSGKLEGIGARLQTDKEYTKVASIVPGGPAWKQKELEANDILLGVQQKDQEPVDIKGMKIDEVVKIVRGKKGTTVILKVKKPNGTVKDITIIRDEVIMDEGFARSSMLKYDSVASNIGYIKLPKFYADFDNPGGPSAAKDIAKELEKLKAEGATSVILDLRNNGGGSLQEVVDMSGLFIEQGPIVQVKNRSNVSPYNDTDHSVQFDGPMVILINNNSASASEIIAACLQDYKRAVIVGGGHSFGKGTVQRFINLDRAVNTNALDVADASGNKIEMKPLGELKITIQKYYRINGGSVQLKGVEPDVIIPDVYSSYDLGEKEYEHPMPFDEISKQNFNQSAFVIANIDEIKQKAADRFAKNERYLNLNNSITKLKDLRKQSKVPLNYDQYKSYMEKRNEEAKSFEKIGTDAIKGVQASNLKADTEYINMDSSRVGRNEDFLKTICKDFQIAESIKILQDIKRY